MQINTNIQDVQKKLGHLVLTIT